MADGTSTLTLPIPPDALLRLRTAERRQRKETLDRGLTAVPVSVEGLLLIQKFLCGCGCGLPLDFEAKYDPKETPPGYPVIAHRLARGSRGEHTPRNVSIDRDACNKRDARPDTSGAASVKRFTPDHSKKDPLSLPLEGVELRDREKMGGGFWRPKNFKQKIPSRPFRSARKQPVKT